MVFSTHCGGVRVFGFSGVVRHGFSSSLGLSGITGDHAAMLKDRTWTVFCKVGLETGRPRRQKWATSPSREIRPVTAGAH
jgi:hypothetical protein